MDQIFSKDQESPQVTEGLLRHLCTIFPLEGFKNVKGERDLFRYQGAQDVIDHLRVLHEHQNREDT